MLLIHFAYCWFKKNILQELISFYSFRLIIIVIAITLLMHLARAVGHHLWCS